MRVLNSHASNCSTKSYVILDWPLRQKTGKHIRTFQSHTLDNGWNNVIEMSYYASDDMRRGTNTPLVARVRGLINTLKGGGRWKQDVANCSVHIWMSLYDCVHQQGFEWKIKTNYEYNGLLEVLSELSSICGGGVFVSINNNPKFHQSTGNLKLTATKVMEMRANAGVIVTDNDLVWKQVSGLTDRNYSSAGDSKLICVLQKKLIVEMIMDVLSIDAQTVSDLEDACVGVSPLQFNVPQGATGGNARYHYKPDFAAHFNKQKTYHEEQRREGKAIGKEDGGGMRSKWYYLEDGFTFAHNVVLNPRPTACTMQTRASIATQTG